MGFFEFIDFRLFDWGKQHEDILAFLTHPSQNGICLCDQPWFRAFFEKWDVQDRQQDAAEFTQFLIEQLGTPKFDSHWECRLLELNEIRVFDQRTHFQPIRLQFPSDAEVGSHFALQTLVDAWCQENGMVKALTSPPDFLCLLVDRHHKDAEGQMHKLEHSVGFFPGCFMPCFLGDDLQTQNESYLVVAVIAHKGNAHHGHYQAALHGNICWHPTRACAGLQWLIQDDNKPMRMSFGIPSWFYKNASLLWLCRGNKVDLFQQFWTLLHPALDIQTYETFRPWQQEGSTSTLLEMLAEG